MMKSKHHIKKQYKGIQIDLYQDMNATWFAFIPNRVNPRYKTINYKRSVEAVQDARNEIDRHIEKYS